MGLALMIWVYDEPIELILSPRLHIPVFYDTGLPLLLHPYPPGKTQPGVLVVYPCENKPG